jgi:epoxyqueuosine reductase QueG
MYEMNLSEIKKNTHEIKEYFYNFLNQEKYKGIFGIANFSKVYTHLISDQQNKLKEYVGIHFPDYINAGSIISVGIFYHPETISYINIKKNGTIDKEKWNLYSDEYDHLNKILNEISSKIAEKFNGIPIPPTTNTPSKEVKYVSDFFPKTISHRVVAEFAGIGWRGKSELLITEQFGSGVRFASIIINKLLLQGNRMESKCGDCTACLDVCPVLQNKSVLEDYRENCRLYLLQLGLNHDVCGKCIKVCVQRKLNKNTLSKI